jgi:hypothetical protein
MKISLRLQNGWAEFENVDEERCDIDGTRLWIAPHGRVCCDQIHTPEQITERGASERIATEGSDLDAWVCICGNAPSSHGFYPCDEGGNEIEPLVRGRLGRSLRVRSVRADHKAGHA